MRMIISLVVEIHEEDWPKSENLPADIARRIAADVDWYIDDDLIKIEDATGVEI
jgi:hypothetical protein